MWLKGVVANLIGIDDLFKRQMMDSLTWSSVYLAHTR